MINKTEEQKLKIFDWTGAAFGIAGAILIALNLGVNWYGYLLFMVSSVCYSYVGWKTNKSGLMVMSLLYIIINVMGLFQWW